MSPACGRGERPHFVCIAQSISAYRGKEDLTCRRSLSLLYVDAWVQLSKTVHD